MNLTVSFLKTVFTAIHRQYVEVAEVSYDVAMLVLVQLTFLNFECLDPFVSCLQFRYVYGVLLTKFTLVIKLSKIRVTRCQTCQFYRPTGV